MATYTFTSIDDPVGVVTSAAESINAAGQIVGYYQDGNNVKHGFLYSGGTFTTVDDPLAQNHPNSNVQEPGTTANSINDVGQIVGVYIDSSGARHGFLYSGGMYTTIDDPSGAKGTLAEGINDAGQIVGYYRDSSNATHGFLYSNGTYTTIDDPLGVGTTGTYGINAAGQIVGSYVDSSGAEHGFLYSGGTYITLDDPLGTNGTIADSINDVGQIIGYYRDANNVQHGFLYSDGTYTTLDDPLATGSKGSTGALSINDAGQIVGGFVDSGGMEHGFLASPPATPPTSVQQEVLGLYAALYGRAAEFPGYSFWIGQVAAQPDGAGVTLGNAAGTAITTNDALVLGQQFVNTQATYFNQVYASLSDSDFINALYINIGGNAGDPGGITYWANLLQQAETGGQSVQAARAGLVGQFVHDLVDVNLAAFTTLTPDQLLAAEQRQGTINAKIAVSLTYLDASQQSTGAILIPHTVGDAAFQAAVTVIQPVTYDPVTVITAITGINNVVAHQDLTLI